MINKKSYYYLFLYKNGVEIEVDKFDEWELRGMDEQGVPYFTTEEEAIAFGKEVEKLLIKYKNKK